MHRPFTVAVQAEIFELRPDYVALSLVAEGVSNPGRHAALDGLVARAREPLAWPAWGDAHLEAWRDAYRAFGAKPQRTPPSVDALAQRARRDGALPAINAVVDLYNALSVSYAIPIGGEDIDAYVSTPTLRRALGHETFDTQKDGAPCTETVPAGEVVWSDDRGVTCRRWNWRQGARTRIEDSTTRMWFVFERLEPMPLPALIEAGRTLERALLALAPDATVSQSIIDRAGTSCLARDGDTHRAGPSAEERSAP